MFSFKQYINGELVEGKGRLTPVLCPDTGEAIGEVRVASEDQAKLALEAARDAFPSWSALTVEARGEWMLKLGAAIREETEKIAEIMAYETGKFISQSVMEVGSLERSLNFFLDQAKTNYDQTIRDPMNRSLNLSIREPLGVIVGYIAWNFPMGNLATKLGPVLASGCTAVLKPATKTPLSTLYIGEIMHRIGFPAGVINFVVGSAREISSVLTKSDIPAMLTLIGSSNAGRELIRDSATSIKRFSLELGGNAPVIVTKNSDVTAAATASMGGKLRNCGQICVSPQRVFVERSVHDKFVAVAKKIADEAKCGAIYETDCDISPMITPESVDRMESLVADALSKGATLVAGGKRPDYKKKGYYFLPTILANVTPDMRVFREEVFGPILAVMAYDDLDKAIEMGNDTEYGLYAYAWTRDIVEANKIARGLQFGTVSINGGSGGIHLPHGGIKESGVGKDGSLYSLDEYYYIKSVRVPVV
ncbi:MAG: aldehyde dehydrogenase family protein [Anaerolineae bacterium]|jgi:succinate-semialdehyde dehydrogenase/glutarate-semialdehyde dehydrogenase